MKDRLIVAILVFIVLITIFAVAYFIKPGKVPEVTIKPQKEVFRTAPDFTLFDLYGTEKKLSDFKGKVVILDFWATWCPPCRALIANFIDLYDEYKDQGLEIIGVAVDRNAEKVVALFAEEKGINYTILLGNRNLPDFYSNIVSIPTIFILDREGRIRKKYVGYRDKDVFKRDIEELL